MTVLFKKQITEKNSDKEIITAIIKVASDKSENLLWEDCYAWMKRKMEEIKRLALILKRRKLKRAEKAGEKLK